MPLRNDLISNEQEVIRGDVWELEITIPGEGNLGGTWEFRLREQRDVGPGEAVGTAEVSSPEDRTVLVTLAEDDTEALAVRDYWYAVRETTADMTHSHGYLRVGNTA